MTIYTHKIHRRGVFYEKETVKMRLWGLVIVPLMIIVFKNLYSLTNGALLGIFFGAVNGSMWEQTKVVMLSYLVWSLVEAIGKRSGFHRFAVSRIISLWFVGIFCLATYLLIYALGVESAGLPRFICAIAVCFSAFALSARLEYGERKIEQLFCLRVYDVAFDCRVLQFYSVPSAHDTF